MKRGRNKSGPGCNADLFDELEQELQQVEWPDCYPSQVRG